MTPNIALTPGDANDSAGDDVERVAGIVFLENYFMRCHRLRMQARGKHGEVLGRQIAKERNGAQQVFRRGFELGDLMTTKAAHLTFQVRRQTISDWQRNCTCSRQAFDGSEFRKQNEPPTELLLQIIDELRELLGGVIEPFLCGIVAHV